MPETWLYTKGVPHSYTCGMSTPPRALGYIRVSTTEQADSGLGLEAQQAAIRTTAQLRGWELVDIVTDAGISGTRSARPGLDAALARMKAGDADLLVVAKLDRLSRSLLDGAGYMATAKAQGWALVDVASSLDMSTPQGRMVAGMLLSAAQYESEMNGARTREAMANLPDEVRDRMRHGGRPRALAPETESLIRYMRGQGKSLAVIAEELTADGVPTAAGGRWWPATVGKVLARS